MSESKAGKLSVEDERERCYKYLLTHFRGLEMSRILDERHSLSLINSLHKLYKMAKGEYTINPPAQVSSK